MMVPQHLQVFLAVGATDMRKSINGLCLLVQMQWSWSRSAGTCLPSATAAAT